MRQISLLVYFLPTLGTYSWSTYFFFWGALFPRTADPIFHKSLCLYPYPTAGLCPKTLHLDLVIPPLGGIRSRSSQQSVLGAPSWTHTKLPMRSLTNSMGSTSLIRNCLYLTWSSGSSCSDWWRRSCRCSRSQRTDLLRELWCLFTESTNFALGSVVLWFLQFKCFFRWKSFLSKETRVTLFLLVLFSIRLVMGSWPVSSPADPWWVLDPHHGQRLQAQLLHDMRSSIHIRVRQVELTVKGPDWHIPPWCKKLSQIKNAGKIVCLGTSFWTLCFK